MLFHHMEAIPVSGRERLFLHTGAPVVVMEDHGVAPVYLKITDGALPVAGEPPWALHAVTCTPVKNKRANQGSRGANNRDNGP